MNLDWWLRDSVQMTVVFAVLVIIAVFTQYNKATRYKSMHFALRALLKAAPALFLTWLAWSLGQNLVALMFLFCSLGDILLDLPKEKVAQGFVIGAISFAAALVCVCVLSYHKQWLPDHPLLRLAITNIVIAIFVLRWVFHKLEGKELVLEIIYFGMLIVTNIFAATSYPSVFLGSSLWFMSDLSIGLGEEVSDDPVNSLDTLGLYDLGLYFLAIGFLNT